MAIVRCPRCRDEVTVPAMATSRALVRCPLCLEEYLLAEALANAPPLLVIIGGEVAQSAITVSTVAGHDYQLAAAADHSPENHWGHVVATTLPTQPITLRTGRRARNREPHFALLFLNWIGGGALGLALAPLVLWWIFRVDPIEMGPTVAAYAPWIVPAQFHANPAVTDLKSQPSPQPAERQPRQTAAESESPGEHSKPTGNVQSRPGQEEINSQELQPKPSTGIQPSSEEKSEPPASQPPRPPMPDLSDLIP